MFTVLVLMFTVYVQNVLHQLRCTLAVSCAIPQLHCQSLADQEHQPLPRLVGLPRSTTLNDICRSFQLMLSFPRTMSRKLYKIRPWKLKLLTRMVQLPATAAMSPLVGCPGPGGFLSGGTFVRGGLMPVPPKFNAYTHRLGFLCLAS